MERSSDSDPKSLGSGLQASTNSSNSAMVVGALNIHGLGVAAAKFIQVVGDVWYEVGVGAVGLLHYAIFVIAKAIARSSNAVVRNHNALSAS